MHLQTLHLHTRKLAEMEAFYRDILECSVQGLKNSFQIEAGTTQLIFSEIDKGNPTYHFAFTIPWNKVEEAMHWTARRVALLELAPGQFIADFRNWDAKAFYFFDPAGNIVEFIAREPLGIESDRPFSGALIASVSEIGLVTDNVALACRQLEELWGVPVFSKQPPTPNFAASGDDHGLFIVVAKGRNWYPTNQPSVKAPVKAVFESNDHTKRTLEIG